MDAKVGVNPTQFKPRSSGDQNTTQIIYTYYVVLLFTESSTL